MKIVDYSTVVSTMGSTKTVENFGKFLGTKPHMLGLVASMYEEYTAAYLTETLGNIYYNEKSGNAYQPINSLVVEWALDTNYIKKVYFADNTGTVSAFNDTDNIKMIFTEKYYDKYDTFVVERSRQVFFVKSAPRRLAENRWEYFVQLVPTFANETVNTSATVKGNFTRFRSNHHPELSERGYAKYQSNTEKHRNYLSLHRSSVSWSSQFAVQEDIFIQEGKSESMQFYKMNKKEKDCLDHFMLSKNNNLLFGKTSFDINGKCFIQDDLGRDIPMGDGLIPQLERYADKSSISKLTINVINEAMSTMRSKSSKETGNKYLFMVNAQLWDAIQYTLRDYLSKFAIDGTYFFSKEGNKSVAVGATFDTYRIGGNEITFKVDRALSIEYSDRMYGVMIDMTSDLASGKPPMAMFTLKGSEMISGNLTGMGGLNGTSSGPIATTVAGSSYELMGYSGIAVFNPYKSYIIEEAKIA